MRNAHASATKLFECLTPPKYACTLEQPYLSRRYNVILTRTHPHLRPKMKTHPMGTSAIPVYATSNVWTYSALPTHPLKWAFHPARQSRNFRSCSSRSLSFSPKLLQKLKLTPRITLRLYKQKRYSTHSVGAAFSSSAVMSSSAFPKPTESRTTPGKQRVEVTH